jgi:Tol biopolymer transport system component
LATKEGNAMTRSPFRRIAAVAVAATATASFSVAGATPAEATFPGHNGRVAYMDTVFTRAHPDGENEIFTIRDNGTSRRRLTSRGGNDDPRWGPFGHRILYTHRSDAGGSQIWVMNGPYGGHKRNLSGRSHHADSQPAWAPGGHRVVFVRANFHAHTVDLVTYSFVTGQFTALQVGDGFNLGAQEPAWSPDGRLIAFSGVTKTATDVKVDLFTVHPDGTGLNQITQTTRFFEDSPNWSPNGSRLVYARAGGPAFCEELDTINPDGTGRLRLRAGCEALGPVWSPNGRTVLAYLAGVHHPGLYVMAPDGTRARFLVSGGAGDWQPLR